MPGQAVSWSLLGGACPALRRHIALPFGTRAPSLQSCSFASFRNIQLRTDDVRKQVRSCRRGGCWQGRGVPFLSRQELALPCKPLPWPHPPCLAGGGESQAWKRISTFWTCGERVREQRGLLHLSGMGRPGKGVGWGVQMPEQPVGLFPAIPRPIPQ